mgnify:CR=1 FL=1
MNLECAKTVHDVLIEVMDISTGIDNAARSLACSAYCPSEIECGTGRSCIECWKHWLESEVTTDDHA